jgi:hypothetical protein
MCNNNDSMSNHAYTIKINGAQSQFNQSMQNADKMRDHENKKIATRSAFGPEHTGYDINR